MVEEEEERTGKARRARRESGRWGKAGETPTKAPPTPKEDSRKRGKRKRTGGGPVGRGPCERGGRAVKEGAGRQDASGPRRYSGRGGP